MSRFNTPDLEKRKESAAAAKKALLERFRAASEDPTRAEREAARKAINAAREQRMACHGGVRSVEKKTGKGVVRAPPRLR